MFKTGWRIVVYDVEASRFVEVGAVNTTAARGMIYAEVMAARHTAETNHATLTRREWRLFGVTLWRTLDGCAAYSLALNAEGKPYVRRILPLPVGRRGRDGHNGERSA